MLVVVDGQRQLPWMARDLDGTEKEGPIACMRVLLQDPAAPAAAPEIKIVPVGTMKERGLDWTPEEQEHSCFWGIFIAVTRSKQGRNSCSAR
jgi:hypothetical protein